MDREGYGPLFWLDTLCCPVEPLDAKNMALKKIFQVYQKASLVLVLDASLQHYNLADLHESEIFARILTSNWMKRRRRCPFISILNLRTNVLVWTLQGTKFQTATSSLERKPLTAL